MAVLSVASLVQHKLVIDNNITADAAKNKVVVFLMWVLFVRLANTTVALCQT